MHLVSVWLSDFGLTLAQVATEAKSNEITAIPEVLRLVDLKGAIITIDAMGTQNAPTNDRREPGVAQTVHSVAAQAASGQRKSRHETPHVRLER